MRELLADELLFFADELRFFELLLEAPPRDEPARFEALAALRELVEERLDDFALPFFEPLLRDPAADFVDDFFDVLVVLRLEDALLLGRDFALLREEPDDDEAFAPRRDDLLLLADDARFVLLLFDGPRAAVLREPADDLRAPPFDALLLFEAEVREEEPFEAEGEPLRLREAVDFAPLFAPPLFDALALLREEAADFEALPDFEEDFEEDFEDDWDEDFDEPPRDCDALFALLRFAPVLRDFVPPRDDEREELPFASAVSREISFEKRLFPPPETRS